MKIAIVCYPTYGGSGVVATELGHALSIIGHENQYITYKQPVRLDVLNENIFFHEVFVSEYDLFHYQPYQECLRKIWVLIFELINVILKKMHFHC